MKPRSRASEGRLRPWRDGVSVTYHFRSKADWKKSGVPWGCGTTSQAKTSMLKSFWLKSFLAQELTPSRAANGPTRSPAASRHRRLSTTGEQVEHPQEFPERGDGDSITD